MNHNTVQSAAIHIINTQFEDKSFTGSDIANALPEKNRRSVFCSVLSLKKTGLIQVIGERKGKVGNRLVELFKATGYISPDIVISHDGKVANPTECSLWSASELCKIYGLVAKPVNQTCAITHKLEG